MIITSLEIPSINNNYYYCIQEQFVPRTQAVSELLKEVYYFHDKETTPAYAVRPIFIEGKGLYPQIIHKMLCFAHGRVMMSESNECHIT